MVSSVCLHVFSSDCDELLFIVLVSVDPVYFNGNPVLKYTSFIRKTFIVTMNAD